MRRSNPIGGLWFAILASCGQTGGEAGPDEAASNTLRVKQAGRTAPPAYCRDAADATARQGKCVPPPLDYGPPREYAGVLRLGFEERVFVPATPIDAADKAEEFWVDTADSQIEACLERLAASKPGIAEYEVVLVGGIHADRRGSFGHMGVSDRAIRVLKILRWADCRPTPGRAARLSPAPFRATLPGDTRAVRASTGKGAARWDCSTG